MALADGEPVSVTLGETHIAVVQVDGNVYAFDDVCTHEFALLSTGFFEGCVIECPLHQATFDVRNGRCLTGPAVEDIRTFPVRIVGDDVMVRLEG